MEIAGIVLVVFAAFNVICAIVVLLMEMSSAGFTASISYCATEDALLGHF